MIQWLDNTFPSWLIAIFIIGFGALAAWIAVRIRHSRTKPATHDTAEPDKPDGANDLTEVFVLMVTGMYGVLAAFMIFTVWTTYDNAQQAASIEGGAISALARESFAFSTADRQEFLLALRAYSESMIHDEWPTMAHGQSSPVTAQLFDHLFVVADSLPATSASSAVSTELMTLSSARTALLLASGAALPDVFWFTLVIGAVLAIGLSVFFSTDVPSVHGLMAVAAAVVICTSLWLIGELDYPLSGDVSVSPAAFFRALYTINGVQTGQYANLPNM